MPATEVYSQVKAILQTHVAEGVDDSSLERLTLLVVGMIRAEHASPARIARALHELGLWQATAESIERRVRRIENDPEITARLCLHPLARAYLRLGGASELLLVLDPTTQDDRVVLITAAVWYRGRALPLAWALWEANVPLEGPRFWERVAALLDQVAPRLPVGVTITWLADRAFGTPSFIDLLTARQWHYVVRIQDQTVMRDRVGRETAVRGLVRVLGQRIKRRGELFKKRGWRAGSLVVYWGRRHLKPLALVSDLPPGWYLLALYRRRYPIEALFRHYKSQGWHFEQGQVSDRDHLERLLVGMALATWLALLGGAALARQRLAKPPSGRRRTPPYEAKSSLFRLGLTCLQAALTGTACFPSDLRLDHWNAPNWHDQLTWQEARAFVFLPSRPLLLKILKPSCTPVRP